MFFSGSMASIQYQESRIALHKKKTSLNINLNNL